MLQIRVGWAVHRRKVSEDMLGHHSIFVGDLSNDVTDQALCQAFQQCEGCSNARVMWDHETNMYMRPSLLTFCSCLSTVFLQNIAS